MKVELDYEDLLKFFNRNKVKYCIVGAFAVAFYSEPRYTKDMDILVEPSFENGKKIVRALREFGFENLRLKALDFTKKGTIIQLGYEPVRIDLITSVDGCNLEEIWKNRKRGSYGKEKVYFISLNELIRNKRQSKRKQDQMDLENLLRVKRIKRSKS